MAIPSTFSEKGEQSLPEKWWTSLDDPKLDSIITLALRDNFDLHSAWQRLLAARAVIDRASAPLLPSVDASVRSGINFPRPDFRGGENVRLGLNTSYEVDLWGRFRTAVDAERFRAESTRSDYHTAVIALSANITNSWCQLAEARGQLQLIDEQIATNERILDLIRSRVGIGQVSSVDLLRQQQLLESGRAQRADLQSRIGVINNRLAVLLGRPPQGSPALAPDSLPVLPPLPQTGIPVELVERRPDVQSAYLQLMAADRDLATAISNQYPRLSFSASTSLRANSLDNLFENWAYSFGSNIFAPLFFGGELKAEIARSEAVKEQRLYEYGQTVLVAFREVEDALVRERRQRERLDILTEQLALAEQTFDQLQVGYFNGATNYLDVLTALTQQQQLRRDLLNARLQLILFRINLYQALAGSIPDAEKVDS